MKLSYIVPVYNVEKYIKECIESILAQTFDDYEIILVDDASPDNCPYICDEYAERYPDIIKVIHKKNSGPAAARNDGLKIASGDYIWFFDSDDLFFGDCVNEIYETAEKNNVDILQMPFMFFRDGKDGPYKSDSVFEYGKVIGHKEIMKYIVRSSSDRSVIFAWRNIYKRAFLIDNNISFDSSLRMLEDPPFNTLAFLKAERFMAADIPGYSYRVRQDSLQRKKYIENYDAVMERQWELKQKYYKDYSDGNVLFYKDIAEFTIKTNLPVLLSNIYSNNIDGKYALLKRIGNSEMIRTSFNDYDINEFKSKSIDWWATFFIKKKLYPLAHIIFKKVLYK